MCSKAFVREDGDQDAENDAGEDALSENQSNAIPGGKNYITPAGHQRLRDELATLLNVQRPEVVRTVSWAAGNGDRSENGDYIYGKRRLREIDRRIRFLQKRLDAAEIVDPAQVRSDTVVFGSKVAVEDESGKIRQYSIVGIDEANVTQGEVSWISPIAKALLGARVGDVVTLKSPRGEEDLEIKSIS